jgi:hypothetical protein
VPWNTARPITSRQQKPRLDEDVEVYKFPKRKFVQVRYIGPFNSYAQAWIRFRKKDRTIGMFPKICLDYDPKQQEFTKDVCPYRGAGIYTPQRFVCNMIVRDIQDNPPRRQRAATGDERRRRKMLGERWRIKDMDSNSYTPVRVHDMPAGVAERLAGLADTNTRRRGGKKTKYDITDPRFGMDVLVKFNPNAKGPNKWEVQRAEPTKLSREELGYLIYNLDGLKSLEPEDRKTARAEWRRIRKDWVPEKKKKRDGKEGKQSGRDSNSRDRRRRSSRSEERRDRNRNKNRRSNRRRNSDLNDLDDLD